MATLHSASTLVLALLVVRNRPFAFLAVVILGTEVLKAPVPILADAAVSSVATGAGEYGRCRLWGAVTWGSVSAVSGIILDQLGFSTSMLFFVLGSSTGAGRGPLMLNTTGARSPVSAARARTGES
jgi:MFS_1 like family